MSNSSIIIIILVIGAALVLVQILRNRQINRREDRKERLEQKREELINRLKEPSAKAVRDNRQNTGAKGPDINP